MKSSIISAILFVFAIAGHAQSSSSCQHRIFFLPQTHATVFGGLQVAPENFDRTARSQFAIAKYLEKYKSIPVFSEQISSDLTVQTASPGFRQAAARIKMMFPQGLPQNFDSLSEDQKNVIARAGGDSVSFILRNTDQLHRVVANDQVEDELFGQLSAWAQKNPFATTEPPQIRNIIFGVRENMALDQINNYLAGHPSQGDVILIYGSDHAESFRTHPDKFRPRCIVTPGEFQPAPPAAVFGQSGGGAFR